MIKLLILNIFRMPATLIRSGVHRQMRVQRYNFFAKRTNIYWKSCTFAPDFT